MAIGSMFLHDVKRIRVQADCASVNDVNNRTYHRRTIIMTSANGSEMTLHVFGEGDKELRLDVDVPTPVQVAPEVDGHPAVHGPNYAKSL